MAYYKEEKEDRVFIPKWEYRALRDIATRVDVLRATIEREKKEHAEHDYGWAPNMEIADIELIMAFDCQKQCTTDIKDVETMDTLADALGYTE